MGHHCQQPHGLERDGLAPRVGAGDQQHSLLRVKRQAYGDHVAGEQRVPGTAELHDARRMRHIVPAGIASTVMFHVLDDRRRGPQGGRVAGLGHVQVQARHDVQGQQQVLRGLADADGQLAQYPFHLALFGHPRLPPAVAHVHGGHGFDEHRRAAVGDIVDDSRNAVAHLRLDQQHHTPVALGNERLLHHLGALEPAQVALHDVVQAALGLPRLRPQPAQQRAGIVQHLSRRADGRSDLTVEVSQLRYVACEAGQEWQTIPLPQLVAVKAGRPGE